MIWRKNGRIYSEVRFFLGIILLVEDEIIFFFVFCFIWFFVCLVSLFLWGLLFICWGFVCWEDLVFLSFIYLWID